jgi:hypothetical protein
MSDTAITIYVNKKKISQCRILKGHNLKGHASRYVGKIEELIHKSYLEMQVRMQRLHCCRLFLSSTCNTTLKIDAIPH